MMSLIFPMLSIFCWMGASALSKEASKLPKSTGALELMLDKAPDKNTRYERAELVPFFV